MHFGGIENARREAGVYDILGIDIDEPYAVVSRKIRNKEKKTDAFKE